jgi:hypothetical protein
MVELFSHERTKRLAERSEAFCALDALDKNVLPSQLCRPEME